MEPTTSTPKPNPPNNIRIALDSGSGRSIFIAAFKGLWTTATSKTAFLLLAIGGVAVAFYHPKPALTFTVSSNTKVLDIRAALGKLDIIYDGQSLKKTNQELRVIVVRVANTSSVDINKEAFDSSDPLGFHVAGGSILESPSIIGSTSYLTRSTRLTEKNSNIILITPLILDSGTWIETKLLVASKAGDTPHIEPIGKIAGVSSLKVIDATEQAADSVWSRATRADAWWIQIIRAPIYLLLFFALIIGLVLALILVFFLFLAPVLKLKALPKKLRRKKVAETYKKTRPLSPADHLVIDEYQEQGATALDRIRKYVTTTNKQSAESEFLEEIRTHLKGKLDDSRINQIISFAKSQNSIFETQITTLARPINPDSYLPKARQLGLETTENNQIRISPDVERAVADFEHFLRSSNENPT